MGNKDKPGIVIVGGNSKAGNYGCGSFIFDGVMVLVTSGLWLIWIFIREMRRK